MSTKGKNHNKRWLISKLKTSGSKKRYLVSGSYAETRNSKKPSSLEDLPAHEGMGKSMQFYNGKINYGLLVRFLRGNINKEWSIVYDEIMQRIPSNLFEYRSCIYWFVADLVEIKEGMLWDKRARLFLQAPGSMYLPTHIAKEFYVHPESGLLLKTESLIIL